MSTIKIKNSTTPSSVPSAASLSQGELAVNISDKKLFVGNASGDPVELTNQGVLSVNGATGDVTVSSIGFTYTASAPGSPVVGDRWMDSDTGKEYIYIYDGSSSQWVEPVASNGLDNITYDPTYLAIGINKTDPQYVLDVNAAAGNCLRLIYGATSGSPTNYVNFAVSSSGDLTLTPSGGDVTMNADMGMNDKTLSRVEFLDYFERLTTPTINAKNSTLTLDLSLSQVFSVSLNNAITTLTISNVPDNGNANAVGFTLILVADGTARSVTWPVNVKWENNSPPTLTSTNGKADILSFLTTDGGTNWYAFIGGQNF